MFGRLKHVLPALMLALAPLPAMAGKANDTIYAAFGLELPNLDKYYTGGREGYLLGLLSYDALIYRDPNTLEFKPLLATAWRQIDELTWEFDLRQGVKFHNGDEFTSADVVYTMDFITNPEAKIFSPDSANWIVKTEALGPYKVRLHSASVKPLALEYVRQNPILPAKYHAAVGREKFGQAPVGTGPYTVAKGPGNTINFTRFDGYFEGGGKNKPNIKNLVYRTIPDVNTQIAELMTGGVDWAYYIPDDQANRLTQVPRLKVTNAETFRIAFLTLDSSGLTDPNTPLKDPRVRKAINYAIDRAAVATKLVGPSSRVVNAACYPTQFGCTNEVTSYGYDVAKAKALMAEAGYANGFDVDIYGYRSQPVAAAILGYLREIGVRGNLRWMQYPAVVKARRERQTAIVIDDFGSSGMNDVGYMLPFFFANSPDDQARDAEVNDSIAKGGATANEAARKENYKKALTRIADQAYWAPLFTMPINYISNAELDIPVPRDENVEFWRAKWK